MVCTTYVFCSLVGAYGEGIVVVKQGSINGGDPGYLYTGQFSSNGDSLSGQLNVKRWNPGHVSVFGPLDNFDLQFSGKEIGANSFTASGGVPSHPGLAINIAGRFLSAAA